MSTSGTGPPSGTVRRRLLVEGRVQGVWFRGSCAERAEVLGVSGWACNLADGRVEVVAEGEPAAVAALERWCHDGPSGAIVTAVRGEDAEPEGLRGFRVLRATGELG